jgi:hypothetical protein
MLGRLIPVRLSARFFGFCAATLVTLQEFAKGVAISCDYTSCGQGGGIKREDKLRAREAGAGGSGGCGGLCYAFEGRVSRVKTYLQRDEGFVRRYPRFF